MAWRKTPADRQRENAVYQDPVYQANRKVCLTRAAGRCQNCGKRTTRLQADHIVPVSQGGTHDLANLQALCAGPGSCHARKTAAEGQGFRRRPDPEPRPRTAW